MISAWDTFFEVDDYYTYKKPVGHGAYGVVISALDTRDNSKVRRSGRGCLVARQAFSIGGGGPCVCCMSCKSCFIRVLPL